MEEGKCPYCGSAEGKRSVHLFAECQGCGRILQERQLSGQVLYSEITKDYPLSVTTPRVKRLRTGKEDPDENEQGRAMPRSHSDKIVDNQAVPSDTKVPKFQESEKGRSTEFRTALSVASVETVPLFTASCTSFSGHLAELERLFGESLCSSENVINGSTVDFLRAYFQIVEVGSVLGLDRDIVDQGVRMFRDCCSNSTYLKNRYVEALATAALVQAMREAQEPRTLQEVAAAAGLPQKEMGRHLKVLAEALKLRQPSSSNCIAVHMPRFCGILQLQKSTEELATHIGEVVMSKSFCTRRNPISISAAAIYLSCQLEDKRKTQTEICKATGLTEVTLRKVYKELLENLDVLLPLYYTPAVPPEKAFPMTTAAMGRVGAVRVASGLGGTEGPAGATDQKGGGDEDMERGKRHGGAPEGPSTGGTLLSGSEKMGHLSRSGNSNASEHSPSGAPPGKVVPGPGVGVSGLREAPRQGQLEKRPSGEGADSQSESRASQNRDGERAGVSGRGEEGSLRPGESPSIPAGVDKPSQPLGHGPAPTSAPGPPPGMSMFSFPRLDHRLFREAPLMWGPIPHMYAMALQQGARPPGEAARPAGPEGQPHAPPQFVGYANLAEAAAASRALGSLGPGFSPHLLPNRADIPRSSSIEGGREREGPGDADRLLEGRVNGHDRGQGRALENPNESTAKKKLPSGTPSTPNPSQPQLSTAGSSGAHLGSAPPPSGANLRPIGFPPFPPNLWPFMAAGAANPAAAAAAWGRMVPPQMVPRAPGPEPRSPGSNPSTGGANAPGQFGGGAPGHPPAPGVPPNLVDAMVQGVLPGPPHGSMPAMWPGFHHLVTPPGAHPPSPSALSENHRRPAGAEQPLLGLGPWRPPANGPAIMAQLNMAMNMGLAAAAGKDKGNDQVKEMPR